MTAVQALAQNSLDALRSLKGVDFKYLSPSIAGDLVAKNLATWNPAMKDPAQNIAVKLLPAGTEYLDSLDQLKAVETAGAWGTEAIATEKVTASKPKKATKSKIDLSGYTYNGVINTVPLPEIVKRTQAAKPEVFPFSKLEIGQSFFVADTDKFVASEVLSKEASLAKLKFSSLSDENVTDSNGNVVTDKKGNPKKKRVYSRNFSVRKDLGRAEDGPQNIGKTGARVQRIA